MSRFKQLQYLVFGLVSAILLSGCIKSHQIQVDDKTHKATINLKYFWPLDISTINKQTLFIIGPHGGNNIENIGTKVKNKFVEVVITTHPLTHGRNYKLVSSRGIKWINGTFLPRQAFIITHSALVDAD